MSRFRTLVEETLENITKRRNRIMGLFNVIKSGIVNRADDIVSLYNKSGSAVFDVLDNDGYRISVEIEYDPQMIHEAGTIAAFAYDLDDKNKGYVSIFLDRPQIKPQELIGYAQTKKFELVIKHELLHYLDEKQSGFKIEVPDYDSIKDQDKLYKTYRNQPTEVHALLYSVIDLLKDKNVKFNTKKELIDLVKKEDMTIGGALEEFLEMDGEERRVHKFLKDLQNGLSA